MKDFQQTKEPTMTTTKPNPVGRPPVLSPCGWCHKMFSARELQKHIAHCPRKLAKGAGQ